ncbi:MAG: mechanosensitive ion channel [Holophaga sp.]|nr:mechanosensitive ion channel [Holophaga sp.]
MKSSHWAPAIALGLAAAAAITGLALTRDRTQAQAPARHEWLVDERPQLTARSLEALAVTPEEKLLVHQAQRVANHEVDLAFADALRQAAENPPPPTPQTRERLAHKLQEEAAVQADQLRIAELGRQASATQDTRLDLAKAQLELDQDELDQATEDLQRVGGDPQARIRRLQAAHAAADAAPPALPAAPALFQNGSLLGKYQAWSAARTKVQRLDQAGQEARAKAQLVAQRRQIRAQRVEQERADRERTKQAAAGLAQAQDAQSAQAAAGGTLTSLQHYMGDQRMLSDMGRRIQDQQDLDEAYAQWGALARGQKRAALHVLIQWLMGVLLVLALVFVADRLFERGFRRMAEGQKRVGRLLKMAKYAAMATGTLAILCVLFGLPSQMTTLFGLAGAGLTVALKDFIVAFFGWFVLVGRNGIHVGDWVEIDGVGGEVVEIGLLRTMLMETGNWSDCGHPTGRIVSFVNSFAMEGHFFNFSSSGQWMWDELQVTVPPGQDPYPLVDAIRRRVEQETAANAKLAEAEWRQSAKRTKGFSALPGINVVPTAAGVEIQIRYITRAYERHETRRVLNQALVELLRGQERP